MMDPILLWVPQKLDSSNYNKQIVEPNQSVLETIMLRFFVFALVTFFASQANAHSCPDFYRFVDFGLTGNDGLTYRGGPTFRAENFNGELLLLEDRTICQDVIEVAKDGHGNPIPVVTSVDYNPEKTGIELQRLRISLVDDTKQTAEKNAEIHQSRLAKPASIVSTRGSNFLCVNDKETNHLSCQLVSPYSGNVSLVIYCDTQECRMPVLAMSERMLINAVWKSSDSFLSNPEIAGQEISETVQKIHDFLTPLSASF